MSHHARRRGVAGASGGFVAPFLDVPWTWNAAYDAAGPAMSAAYADTDPVTGAWLDEVGSEDVTRQAGGTLTYNGSDAGLGNRPSITFDGTGYFAVDAGADVARTHSVVTVMKHSTTATSGFWVDGFNVTARHVVRGITAGKWRLFAGVSLETTSNFDTAAHMHVTVVDSTTANSRYRLDGVTESTGSAGTDSFRPITIGAANGGGGNFQGAIAAIGYFGGDIIAEGGFASWESTIMSHYGL